MSRHDNTTTEEYLELVAVAKTYGGTTTAVEDVTLSLEEGSRG